MKNKTIIELWKYNKEELPFPVRRNTWSQKSYAMIHEVIPGKWPYGDALGIYVINGTAKSETNEKIECAGNYQWEYAIGVNGFKQKEFKPKSKSVKLYKKNDLFDFGKYYHKGLRKGLKSIKQVFKENPAYIKWCLKNVESFCLDPEELKSLNPEDPDQRIGGKLRKINYDRYDSFLEKNKG